MPLIEQDLARKANHNYAAYLLEGEFFKIWPYARSAGYPPDTLYALWKAMQAEDGVRRVLYESKRLDLEAFMAYFSDALVYIATTKDLQHVLGTVWFTAIKKQQAQVGIFFSRRAQGNLARNITNRVLLFAFATYQWQTIWGLTPWRMAARHGVLLGFKHIATVPDFIEMPYAHKRMPLHVIRLDNPLPQGPDLDLIFRRVLVQQGASHDGSGSL